MGDALSAEDLFEQGIEYFDRGDFGLAADTFETSHRANPDDALTRSYLGVCTGLARGDFEGGLELCREAAKQEFFNPEQYLNLARIHFAFGFKTEGIRYLRRGQMIDPAHTEIACALADLGLRGQPVLAFLPRKHIINRWLGVARHYLAVRAGEEGIAA